MNGNPFAPIAQGMRDIGQGYYQGQMAKMGMQERTQQREQQESHRKVTYGMSLLNMAESSEDKRKIIERFIAPEMNGVLDDLDLFRDLPDTATFLTEQHNLFTAGKQTPQQYLNNLQRFVFTHPKSEVGKEALEYRRDVAKEERKLKAATAKEIFGMLAKGEIVEVPKEGLISDLEDKTDMFEYPSGSGQWFKRVTEPKEPTFEEKERIKAKYKAPPKGADKETVIQNYINKFKTPPGVMGEIKTRKPAERRSRLKGLFQTMDIERKRGKLNEDDIGRVVQTVMTDLGIMEGLQHGVRAAMMAGATADQLLKVIDAYELKEKEEMK